MTQFKGVVPAMITPFDAQGRVDYATIEKHANFLFDNGVSGLCACGSTGEYDALSLEERAGVYRAAVRTAKARGGFVLAGCGGMATWEAIHLAREAEKAGCDAVLLLPPYYYGFGRDEVLAYYRDVAAAVSLPVMIYNNPGKTRQDVTPDMVGELAASCPNIRYIKESSSDVRRVMEIAAATGGKVTVFSGWDSITLESLWAGSKGILSGGANCVPDVMVRLYTLATTGKHDEAYAYYAKVRPLLVLLEDHGRLAAWIKATVGILHHDVGLPRRPYLPLRPDEEARIRKTLAQVGLL